VQGEDQLPLTVGMRRNILLRLHHPNTKGNGRFVATVRFITIQTQSIIMLSDISDNLSF
jgi:hypothetical protein